MEAAIVRADLNHHQIGFAGHPVLAGGKDARLFTSVGGTSLIRNPAIDQNLRFNVRIATPPRGQDCPAGAGSSYVFRLNAGDEVAAIGPFGDFLIKESIREMIYLGGGAGMAPLRSHLSYLFDTLKTTRKVSYWYDARSGQEVFSPRASPKK